MRGPASTATTRDQIREALGCLDAGDRGDGLYAGWYAKPRHPAVPPAGCPPQLGELLRAADAGSRVWEGGWRVERVGPRGEVVVRRGDASRLLERIDYAPVLRAGLLPHAGDEVTATVRRDQVDADGGWWRTAGGAWSWRRPPAGLVRLYVNCGVEGLPAVVGRLTGLLADEPAPWMLKCATDPAVYGRRDAVVAFVARAVIDRCGEELVRAVGDAGVRRGAPPLTLAVAPGVGVAFDPGGDESFGAHRCRLIANAAGGTVDDVLGQLAGAGVDPARPWASIDDDLLPWER